jgi:hypothetical protein
MNYCRGYLPPDVARCLGGSCERATNLAADRHAIHLRSAAPSSFVQPPQRVDQFPRGIHAADQHGNRLAVCDQRDFDGCASECGGRVCKSDLVHVSPASWSSSCVNHRLPLQLKQRKSLQRHAWNFLLLQNPASGFPDSRNGFRQRSQRHTSTSSAASLNDPVTHGSRVKTIRRHARFSGCFTRTMAGAFLNISCAVVGRHGGLTCSGIDTWARRQNARSSNSICEHPAP